MKSIYDKDLGVNHSNGVYLFDYNLKKISLGVSQKEVQSILGTPTLVRNFDNSVWYYIYQKSKSFAVFKEHIMEQNVLTLYFNNKGILIKQVLKKLPDFKSVTIDSKKMEFEFDKRYLEPDYYN